jgi:regulatory protein
LTRNRRPETNPAAHLSKGGYQKAFNTALRLLTRRDHSKYELAQKLKQRAFEDDVIERVCLECERLDYLNDERTAQVFINQLFRRGCGAKRIRAELKRKGLTGRRIAGILNAILSEAGEQENAERVLSKNMKRFDREDDCKKRKAKIYRFLYSRGFSNQIISEVMKKY